jgi:general secretion pathway protein N
MLALGLGVYLAFTAVSFPASVAYRWFAPPALALASIEGTIWRGSAAYGGIEGLAFSGLRWQLHPAALLRGRVSLTAELRLADGNMRANLTASGNGIELTDVRATTDLQAFRDWLSLGDVRGRMSASLDTLDLVDGWPVAASGNVRIADLAIPPVVPVSGVTIIPLGNFAADVAPAHDPGISAVLSDEGGPLELAGSVTLSPGGAYVLDARIKPRAGAPDVLVEGLELMTEPLPDGQRHFVLSGSL